MAAGKRMSRTAQIRSVSVPPKPAKQVQALDRAQRELDEQRWVENLIAEAKAEEAANPMSIEEMHKEADRIARYGERQAKKLGIKPKDIDRLIREYRRERRS
jgi:hypothetical protein